MTDDLQFQQEYQQYQQEIDENIRAVIVHAAELGLPQDEVKLLQWASGVRAHS